MHIQAPNIAQPQASTARASASTPTRAQPDTDPASAVASATSGSVREAVAAINRAAKSLNNSIQLSLDDRSNQAVVRVLDSETGQLIRQIPSEEILELRRALDKIAGLLINRTA